MPLFLQPFTVFQRFFSTFTVYPRKILISKSATSPILGTKKIRLKKMNNLSEVIQLGRVEPGLEASSAHLPQKLKHLGFTSRESGLPQTHLGNK